MSIETRKDMIRTALLAGFLMTIGLLFIDRLIGSSSLS